MECDVQRMLIESSVRKALGRIDEDPARSVRNLVDLGVSSVRGPVASAFLSHVQELLRADERSAYFNLVQRMVSEVELDTLITFGLNLGYEGCIKGAKTIRAAERERGFNVPWAISIVVAEDEGLLARTAAVLEEAYSLGVRVFNLYTGMCPELGLRLAEHFDDCAFVICTKPSAIDARVAAECCSAHNALISVAMQDDVEYACALLRSMRTLYGVHVPYPDYRQSVSPRHALSRTLGVAPYFIIFIPSPGCTPELASAVHSCVQEAREEQRYPVIVFDMLLDRIAIDSVISNDACAAGFDEHGQLVLLDGIVDDPSCNVYERGLAHVLAEFFPKTIDVACSA